MKKISFILAVVFIMLSATYAFATTIYDVSYNNQNDFYYGSFSGGKFDHHVEHWPGYNQTSGGDTRTYYQVEYTWSGDETVAYETTFNCDFLDPERLESASHTPGTSDREDILHYHDGNMCTRTVGMNISSGSDWDIYIPYTWLPSSGSYTWDDYYLGSWCGAGEYGEGTLIYDGLFEKIWLSN